MSSVAELYAQAMRGELGPKGIASLIGNLYGLLSVSRDEAKAYTNMLDDVVAKYPEALEEYEQFRQGFRESHPSRDSE